MLLPRETISVDPDGVRTELIYEGGIPIIKRVLPHSVRDRTISANRAAQNAGPSRRGGMRHVARLDQAMLWLLYQEWGAGKAKKGGIAAMLKDDEFMWKKLNDSDYKWMRTSEGAEGPRSTHRPKKHFIMSAV